MTRKTIAAALLAGFLGLGACDTMGEQTSPVSETAGPTTTPSNEPMSPTGAPPDVTAPAG